MPDGTIAKVYRDGDKVRDEAGHIVNHVRADEFPDSAPPWAQRHAAGEVVDRLTAERHELQAYQQRLETAGKELSSGELTEDRLKRLDAGLAQMPESVRRHYEASSPGPAQPTSGGKRDSAALSSSIRPAAHFSLAGPALLWPQTRRRLMLISASWLPTLQRPF